MKKKVRVALATLDSRIGEKKFNIEKAIKTIDEAKKKDCDLIVFPELYISGYTCSPIIQKLAETIPGPTTYKLVEKTRECNCYLVIGIPEKTEQKIYNSAVLLGPEGVVGVYRKFFLGSFPQRFDEKKPFTAGESFPVWFTNIGNIGLMICYDAFFPEVTRILTINGAELIICIAGSADSQSDFSRYIPARASENTVFLIFVNQVGSREDGKRFFGASRLIGPNGNVIVKAPNELVESLIVGIVDYDEIPPARSKRPLLSDIEKRRFEIYRGKAFTNPIY